MRQKYYESLAIEHKESMPTKLICLLLVFATVFASAMAPVLSPQPLDKGWTNSIYAKLCVDYLPKNQPIPEIDNSGSDRFVLEPELKLESSSGYVGFRVYPIQSSQQRLA